MPSDRSSKNCHLNPCAWCARLQFSAMKGDDHMSPFDSASTQRQWAETLRQMPLDDLAPWVERRLTGKVGPRLDWDAESPEDMLIDLAREDKDIRKKFGKAVGRLLFPLAEDGLSVQMRNQVGGRAELVWRLLRLVHAVPLESASPALAALVYSGTLINVASPFSTYDSGKPTS